MNFEQNTGKTIQQAFEEYHKANPRVYRHFCRLAFKAIRRGHNRISAKLILNVIRWEVYLQPKPKDATSIVFGPDSLIEDHSRVFKVNDAYGSRYARLFLREFPEYEPFFEIRELRS